MSLTSTSSYPVELERRYAAPALSAELEYPYAPRVTRREWQMLLDSWERLQPTADRFATVFFDTLFRCEPTLRYLFGGTSLETQFMKFAHLLTELVSAEDDPRELDHRMDAVVKRYGRGSLADHDRAIRTAISAMLAEVSAARLTPEIRRRWKAARATVVTALRNAAPFTSHSWLTTLIRNTRIETR